MNISRKLSSAFQLVLTVICICFTGTDTEASDPPYDAVMVLKESGFDTSFDNLSSTFLDANADLRIRQLAALALGQSGDRRALDILSSELEDPIMEIRGAALSGMKELADPPRYSRSRISAGER